MYFRSLSIALILFLIPTLGHAATTRYVRADGGNGTQCDGLADHAYPPVAGTACGLISPNWVFPPTGASTSRAAAAGDTVVIESGSYRIGNQGTSNGSDSNVNVPSCSGDTCMMGIVPSNTTVIGCTTSGCGCSYNLTTKVTTCTTTRPELWGAGSTGGGSTNQAVIKVINQSNITIQDLNITDHESCGGLFGCPSTNSNMAMNYGINQQGVSGLTLKNVDVHGMKVGGIFGGYIGTSGVTYDNTHVFGNPLVGVDFSNNCSTHNCGSSAASTPFTFKNHTSVKYAGCNENYPLTGTIGTAASIRTASCFEQNTGGGYGDGVGYDSTSGTLTVTDSEFSYNTSDGLDAKYFNGFGYSGGTAVVKRNVFEGNLGACFKTYASTYFEDNVCIANTQYWHGNSLATGSGNSFGFNRGNTAIQLGYDGGTGASAPMTLINNTILSNMAISVALEQFTSSITLSNPIWTFKNNIFAGGYNFTNGSPSTLFFAYGSNSSGTTVPINGSYTMAVGNNICGTVNGSSTIPVPCTGTNKNEAVTSTFSGSVPIGTSGGSFNNTGYWTGVGLISNMTLKSTSQAINNGDTSFGDILDYNSFSRGLAWDSGAIEFGSTASGGATCGNNTTESGETCDGSDLNSQTCVTQGFTAGSLSCAANCLSFNTSSCTTNLCGNSNIDGTEQCDTANLNGQTCISQGFSSGTLACSGSCTFNTSGCTALACPNGVVDSGEQCDDSNSTNLDGCSSRCELEGSGLEQFLTYTAGNPNSYFDIHTNQLIITGAQTNSNTYLRKDFTASHFGDFIHDFKVTVNGCTNSGINKGGAGVWAMSAGAYTDLSALENAADGLDFSLSCSSSSSQYTWQLYSAEGATAVATYNDIIPTLIRYIRIQRSGTALTASLYSDANHTNLLHTLSITVPTTSYRYLYPGIIYNAGTTGMSFDGEILNLNLSPGTVSTPTTYGTKLSGCTCYGASLK